MLQNSSRFRSESAAASLIRGAVDLRPDIGFSTRINKTSFTEKNPDELTTSVRCSLFRLRGIPMCGRARCTLSPDQVPAACGFQGPLKTVRAESFRSSYNVSPGSYMPVVRFQQEENNRTPEVHFMKWGLIPGFTKKSEKPDYFRMFNARSESVHEKASFRRLLSSCRCVTTVEGFYEWKKDGARKQPYYIHLKDGRPIVFAALFDVWTNSEGETLYTFTILTTASSKSLGWLHDRMPVILGSKQAVHGWLSEENNTFESLQGLLKPYENDDLAWYPVTPMMGKVSFDGPECVKPVKVACETKNSITQLFNKQHSVEEHAKAVKEDHDKESVAKNCNSVSVDDLELEPDEDVKPALQGKENLLGEVVATPSKVPDDKGIKRKQCFEPSPPTKSKVAPYTGERQRSLLNFFAKQ